MITADEVRRRLVQAIDRERSERSIGALRRLLPLGAASTGEKRDNGSLMVELRCRSRRTPTS